MTTPTQTWGRPLHQIATEIRMNWEKPYFGAVPYLDAMGTLNSVNDNYGCDPARQIIAYFLANASTFRGVTARMIKLELKALLKQ